MKITNDLNKYNYSFFNNYKKLSYNTRALGKNNYDLVSFCSKLNEADLKIQESADELLFQEFLHKKGRAAKKECDKITENNQSFYQKALRYINIHYIGNIKPSDLVIIAKEVDAYLKENYENPRIISVGTSPAILCDILASLGHDVVFLPATNCTEMNAEDEIPDNLKPAFEYLKYQGLKNDEKTNIVLDYVHSGGTLNFIYSQICKYFNDIPKDKIKKITLQELLEASGSQDYTCMLCKRYLKDVKHSTVEYISSTPHFNIKPDVNIKPHSITVVPEGKTNEQIFKEFDEYSTPLSRAFFLCTQYIV